MQRNIRRERQHQTMKLVIVAAIALTLSSCATAAPPCAQVDASSRIVGGHNAFQFRRDWVDFRSDLSDFRAAAPKQDADGLREAVPELNQSIAAIKRYSPSNAGEACEALTIAKVKLNSTAPQLEQLAVSADWAAASRLASELTDMSERLREGLPSSWFVRHRHGRHFH
jgi:hypothetical protein